MNIYIMSRGRAGKVNTLNWISEKWRKNTVVICSYGELSDYLRAYPNWGILGAPREVTNYSQKFQWILNGYTGEPWRTWDENEKAIIMDDDLVFSARLSPDKPDSLISIRDPSLLDDMWARIEQELSVYPLVGVHPRQNGQLAERPHVLNGRIICLQGINRRMIGHVKVDQFPILADVVLSCTLLSRGQPNALLTTFFQDHGPCQAPGGCSIYRTPDMQRDAVTYLANRFPGFVKVVERRPKVAKWMGDVRYDYQCQWKRLFAAGRAHLLDPRTAPNPDKEGDGTSTQAME